MRVLSTLALVLLVPASTLSSATQIDPQIKFTDMRLSQVMDYHRALFSLESDDLGLEMPVKDKFGKLFHRFDWPQRSEAGNETGSEIDYALETGDTASRDGNGKDRNGNKNVLLMTLSGLGLIGFMSMRRRRH